MPDCSRRSRLRASQRGRDRSEKARGTNVRGGGDILNGGPLFPEQSEKVGDSLPVGRSLSKKPPCFRLHDRQEATDMQVSIEFPVLGIAERTRSRLRRQFIDPVFIAGWKLHRNKVLGRFGGKFSFVGFDDPRQNGRFRVRGDDLRTHTLSSIIMHDQTSYAAKQIG
jgi:hypothetical protein